MNPRKSYGHDVGLQDGVLRRLGAIEGEDAAAEAAGGSLPAQGAHHAAQIARGSPPRTRGDVQLT